MPQNDSPNQAPDNTVGVILYCVFFIILLFLLLFTPLGTTVYNFFRAPIGLK